MDLSGKLAEYISPRSLLEDEFSPGKKEPGGGDASKKALVIILEGNNHCAVWFLVSQICLLAKTATDSYFIVVES